MVTRRFASNTFALPQDFYPPKSLKNSSTQYQAYLEDALAYLSKENLMIEEWEKYCNSLCEINEHKHAFACLLLTELKALYARTGSFLPMGRGKLEYRQNGKWRTKVRMVRDPLDPDRLIPDRMDVIPEETPFRSPAGETTLMDPEYWQFGEVKGTKKSRCCQCKKFTTVRVLSFREVDWNICMDCFSDDRPQYVDESEKPEILSPESRTMVQDLALDRYNEIRSGLTMTDIADLHIVGIVYCSCGHRVHTIEKEVTVAEQYRRWQRRQEKSRNKTYDTFCPREFEMENVYVCPISGRRSDEKKEVHHFEESSVLRNND